MTSYSILSAREYTGVLEIGLSVFAAIRSWVEDRARQEGLVKALREAGEEAWVAGEITAGARDVQLD